MSFPGIILTRQRSIMRKVSFYLWISKKARYFPLPRLSILPLFLQDSLFSFRSRANDKFLPFLATIVLSYDRYRGYSASYARRRAQINKRARVAGVCVRPCPDTCINHILVHVLYTHTCVHTRMRKHRPRVKAFDAMFVVKDELFSTRRRLLACTWRDKSSWIFRAPAWRLGKYRGEKSRTWRIVGRPHIAPSHDDSRGERDSRNFSFR